MHQNLNALKQIGSTKKVNLLVQWDEPFKHTTWRFKIGKNKFVDDCSIKQDMGINPTQELIDASSWAFEKYPAKQFALIFWNHGSGILDEKHSWKKHRGILYDFSSGKCLTNRGLYEALSEVHKKTLKNKKIDLIGMDACLMGMVEIAYQIKDFAHYFVASENIELAPGWDYKTIINAVTKAPQDLNSKKFSNLIVQSFETFNRNKNQIYTQSSIDLGQINTLKKNIAEFAQICVEFSDNTTLQKIIYRSRNKTTEFDNGHFIDVHDFFYQIEKEVLKKKIDLSLKNNLLDNARAVQQAVKHCVMANRSGRYFKAANGISIYYPRTKKLHKYYTDTLFAQETLWPDFLKKFALLQPHN